MTNIQKGFLNKYIEHNKITSSNEMNRFPSIEARRKYTNEYNPTMVDSKQILQVLKEAEQEKVYRRNKLILEKFIVHPIS